jgi:hypothetical protein
MTGELVEKHEQDPAIIRYPIYDFGEIERKSLESVAAIQGIPVNQVLNSILLSLSQGSQLVVEFEVPALIRKGLMSGDYVRKGGLILQSDTRQVVYWLKEGKAFRRIDSVIVAKILTDIWSDHVLNEKLSQIQRMIRELQAYVKAEHFHPLKKAHDCLMLAKKVSQDSNRAQLLHEALSNFQTARTKTLILYDMHLKKLHGILVDFFLSRFSNTGELDKICDALIEMCLMAKKIAHCYECEATVLERLNEVDSAFDRRVESFLFLFGLCEHAASLENEEIPYAKTQEVKRVLGDIEPWNHGLLLDNVKSWTRPMDGIVSIFQTAVSFVPWTTPDPKEEDSTEKQDNQKEIKLPGSTAAKLMDLQRHLDELSRQALLAYLLIIDVQPSEGPRLYFGGKDGLFAVDAESGKQLWLFETPDPVVSKPLIFGTTVVCGCHGGKLVAVDTESRTEKWSVQTNNKIWSSLTSCETDVLFAMNDKRLVRANPATGEVKWEYESSGTIKFKPEMSDDSVFVSSSDGCVASLDPKTGESRWTFKKGDWWASPICVESNLTRLRS